MAELWGSVVVSLLFWGFANQASAQASICQPLAAFANVRDMLMQKVKSEISIASVASLYVARRVQITTVDEAKTFYPLFGLGANVALIFSGRAVKYFSQVRSHSLQHKDKLDPFGFI